MKIKKLLILISVSSVLLSSITAQTLTVTHSASGSISNEITTALAGADITDFDTIKVTGTATINLTDCRAIRDLYLTDTLPSLDFSEITFENNEIANASGAGTGAFENSRIQSIVLPESLKKIGSRAFIRATTLVNITIPNRVVVIGDYAFQECEKLILSALPTNLETLGKGAFRACPEITISELPLELVGTLGARTFQDCAKITVDEIPSGITSLAGYVFQGCPAITNMTFHGDFVEMGNNTFTNCPNLKELHFKRTIPPVTTGTSFGGTTPITEIDVYIPKNALTAYNVSPWSSMKFIHETEETGTTPELGDVPISSDSNYPKLIYNQDLINFVAEKVSQQEEPWYSAYNNLISIANGYSKREHEAVADFSTPRFYGDKDENIDKKSGLASDAHAAHANALAFVLNGDEKYAQKAIYKWKKRASINTTITAVDSAGDATGSDLTATNLMSGFLIAADLLLGQSVWPENEKIVFKQWVETVYLTTASSIKRKSNNWGDWGTFGTAASYHILKDNGNLTREITRMKSRIRNNQNEDGSMPNETRRESNGLWYTYFALTPATLSATLILNTIGENLFTYTENGRSLKKALDYLYYYIFHKSEWPWYPMTDSAPGKDAPCDLFEAMNEYYNNQYTDYTIQYRPVKGSYKGTRVSHTGWCFPTLMSTHSNSTASFYNPENHEYSIFYIEDNKIQITGCNSDIKMELYNMQGLCLKKTESKNGILDISELAVGIYVLRVNEQTIKIMRK